MREKLIEVLNNIQKMGVIFVPSQVDDRYGYKKEIPNATVADHLIANGVTVQQWIPVKDRLPEDDSNVLAYLRIGEEGRIYPAHYAKGVWWDCIFSTPATKTTTHWMPLPEPPEGE